jgi:AmmeMemoRadiSam system protein A
VTSLLSLSTDDQGRLLRLARQAIEHGLQHHRPVAVDEKTFPVHLLKCQAVFVTLHAYHELRGCIGTLEADQSLVANVAKYAYLSAFSDSRFAELTWGEFADLDIQISLLSPLEPMSFADENDLLAQIRPGEDGLLLEAGYNRGTFLPSVWEHAPKPEEFWRLLKRKAGLAADYWEDDIRVSRYTTHCFSAAVKDL